MLRLSAPTMNEALLGTGWGLEEQGMVHVSEKILKLKRKKDRVTKCD